MVEPSDRTRRTLLKATGVTFGTAAFGSAAYAAATQRTNSHAPGVNWQHTYDLDLGDDRGTGGRDVLQTSDGGYTVATNGGVLLRLDSDGTAQWHTIVGGNPYALVRATDGGYVMAGSVGANSDSDADAWLVKTDAMGEVVWERTLGEWDAWFGDVVPQPDGGYVAVGEKGNAWLVAVTDDGTVEGDRTYEPLGEPETNDANTVFHSVVRGGDGGYAIAGGEQGDNVGWILKVDRTHDPEWDKNFESNEFVTEVIRTRGGRYAVVAGREDDYLLATVTESGKHVFTERYGTEDRTERAQGLVQSHNGGYILYGNRDDTRTPWLVGTDDAGRKQWSTVVADRSWAPTSPNPIATTEGGFVVVGTKGGNVENTVLVTTYESDSTGETPSATERAPNESTPTESATETSETPANETATKDASERGECDI